MNKPKHTPGPWIVDGNGFDPSWNISGSENSICDVRTSRADAQLMSAAPELLEALEWIQGHVSRCAAKDSKTDEYGLGRIEVPYGVGTVIDAHLVLEKLKTAIVRATGGSNE